MAKVRKALVTLDPRTQTRESLVRVLDHILTRGGCTACGRLSVLAIDFSDPIKEKLPGLVTMQVRTEGRA